MLSSTQLEEEVEGEEEARRQLQKCVEVKVNKLNFTISS